MTDARLEQSGTSRLEVLTKSARGYMLASRPRSREAHLVGTMDEGHLFVPNGSQLFDAPPSLFSQLNEAIVKGVVSDALTAMGLQTKRLIDDVPVSDPPLHALSLAIAQKCNLGCTYCYAQQGEFGGAAKNMPQETADQAVDLLLDSAEPGARLNLAFLGGEPLVNRRVLQAVTRRASMRAKERGVSLTFSITTNGTLLTEADAAFFEEFGFAVTISLDGPKEVHDAQRPFKDGRGSFENIMVRIRPLLAIQRKMQVSARVTVTPGNLGLRETLDQFVSEGFHGVGFSPMLRSPTGSGELDAAQLEIMLGEMIDCGREAERRWQRGERYPFANLHNALKEIRKGTHRPYPCGAGAGYLGVSAEGDLAACHRFVGDDAGSMGTLGSGIDATLQNTWLAERHVHQQSPCQDCWARYLCGGGCHHEVIERGRPACDYIRGWLHYCLEVYLRRSEAPESTST